MKYDDDEQTSSRSSIHPFGMETPYPGHESLDDPFVVHCNSFWKNMHCSFKKSITRGGRPFWDDRIFLDITQRVIR